MLFNSSQSAPCDPTRPRPAPPAPPARAKEAEMEPPDEATRGIAVVDEEEQVEEGQHWHQQKSQMSTVPCAPRRTRSHRTRTGAAPRRCRSARDPVASRRPALQRRPVPRSLPLHARATRAATAARRCSWLLPCFALVERVVRVELECKSSIVLRCADWDINRQPTLSID